MASTEKSIVTRALVPVHINSELNKKLIECSKNGDLSGLKDALDRGANINANDGSGTVVLHAVKGGFDDLVVELARRHADLNKPCDGIDWLPIFSASWKLKLETVVLMVDNGANIHRRQKTGGMITSAATMAVRANRPDVLKFYFSRGVKLIETERVQMLEIAGIFKNDELISILTNCQGQMEQSKTADRDSLFHAVQRGYINYVVTALNNGESPEIEDQYGERLLMVSAGYGEYEITKAVLDAGADPDAKSPRGTKYPECVIVTALGHAIGGWSGLVSKDQYEGWDAKLKEYEKIFELLLKSVSVDTCYAELDRILSSDEYRIRTSSVYRKAAQRILERIMELNKQAKENVDKLLRTHSDSAMYR
jgi:hypothetical protein